MLRGGIPFSNAPGVAYEYSNYGFAILGAIVSRASGMSYNQYLTRKVLEPLGMTSTTMEPAKVPADRLAHGYRRQDGAWLKEPLLADGAFGSMGGMLTTTRDLGRYVAAQLAAWPPRDEPESGPIRRASLREMQQIARLWRLEQPRWQRCATDDRQRIRLRASSFFRRARSGMLLRTVAVCLDSGR